MAAPGTTGSHSTSSRVIRSFLAQPLDVIRPIRSSYSGNNVYLPIKCKPSSWILELGPTLKNQQQYDLKGIGLQRLYIYSNERGWRD